jgi:hypothetical protein
MVRDLYDLNKKMQSKIIVTEPITNKYLSKLIEYKTEKN